MAGIKLPPLPVTHLPGAASPHRLNTIKGALSHSHFAHNVLLYLTSLIHASSHPTPSTAAMFHFLPPLASLRLVRFPVVFSIFSQTCGEIFPIGVAMRPDFGDLSAARRCWSTVGPIDHRQIKVHRAVHPVHRIYS
jgi:hypothetical protein